MEFSLQRISAARQVLSFSYSSFSQLLPGGIPASGSKSRKKELMLLARSNSAISFVASLSLLLWEMKMEAIRSRSCPSGHRLIREGHRDPKNGVRDQRQCAR